MFEIRSQLLLLLAAFCQSILAGDLHWNECQTTYDNDVWTLTLVWDLPDLGWQKQIQVDFYQVGPFGREHHIEGFSRSYEIKQVGNRKLNQRIALPDHLFQGDDRIIKTRVILKAGEEWILPLEPRPDALWIAEFDLRKSVKKSKRYGVTVGILTLIIGCCVTLVVVVAFVGICVMRRREKAKRFQEWKQGAQMTQGEPVIVQAQIHAVPVDTQADQVLNEEATSQQPPHYVTPVIQSNV